MTNLNTIELKSFIPARDFALSKRFYKDMGFSMASDDNGIAYFHAGNCSFLLQDFYQQQLAENLMMHLLVEDVAAWHQQILQADLAGKYGSRVSDLQTQPWGMRDFTLSDPSGVLWRIAQNL